MSTRWLNMQVISVVGFLFSDVDAWLRVTSREDEKNEAISLRSQILSREEKEEDDNWKLLSEVHLTRPDENSSRTLAVQLGGRWMVLFSDKCIRKIELLPCSTRRQSHSPFSRHKVRKKGRNLAKEKRSLNVSHYAQKSIWDNDLIKRKCLATCVPSVSSSGWDSPHLARKLKIALKDNRNYIVT